jgi:hypothetical protein
MCDEGSQRDKKLSELETAVKQSDTTDLKAQLAELDERFNNAMVKLEQAVGKLSEVDSHLANFRRWVEQELTTQDDDGTGCFKNMTDVRRWVEAVEGELQELRVMVNQHDVAAAIARQQAQQPAPT